MSKVIPFHILNTLAQALIEVFEKGKHADRMIDKYLRANRNWKPEDRRFFAEALYSIVRHRRLLEFAAESEDLWLWIAAYLVSKDLKPTPRPEFAAMDSNQILSRLKAQKDRKIEHSYPDWLWELGVKEFGEDWDSIAASLNREPKIYLRANTLQTSSEKLAQDLKKENILASKVVPPPDVPDALCLKERRNVFATEAYKNGDFEMQDAGSQVIAPLLQVEPGQSVVDTCAGSGGKTLHLAALMKNQGKILALDIIEQKLIDLKTRATRAGVAIIETKLISPTQAFGNLENQFDRVLIDSPCSGLGVLRRNPDTKWKMDSEQVIALLKTQRDLLSRYSILCKPGGIMVYATCSVLKRENEEQIKWFLKSKFGRLWKMESELRLWPQQNDTDAFYAAVLKKY